MQPRRYLREPLEWAALYRKFLTSLVGVSLRLKTTPNTLRVNSISDGVKRRNSMPPRLHTRLETANRIPNIQPTPHSKLNQSVDFGCDQTVKGPQHKGEGSSQPKSYPARDDRSCYTNQ